MPTFFNYPDLEDRLIVLDGWSKAYAMTVGEWAGVCGQKI